MAIKILYVTSFGPDMYATTGIHLIESFLQTKTDGQLLVCHEGGLADRLKFPDNLVSLYDLDKSIFLREWLSSNQDIIPVELGGAADKCECPDPDNPFGLHRPRCPYQWFNKNASRWFRKLVSLEKGMTLHGFDALVWIDSDCRFKKQLPYSVWESLFERASILYHKSPDREVIESGVIAFKMDEGGRRTLEETIGRYRSGRFRDHFRWDDGYQFQVAIQNRKEVVSIDLATHSGAFQFVLPSSPIGEYIDHYKGVHGTVLRLMR